MLNNNFRKLSQLVAVILKMYFRMYFRRTLLNRIAFDCVIYIPKKLHFHEEVHVLRTLRIMPKCIIVSDWVKYLI